MTDELAPKRQRIQQAKAVLWMDIAVWAQQWSRSCRDKSSDTIPFDQWPPNDPMVMLAKAFDLTPDDLAALWDGVAQEAEQRSERAGWGRVDTAMLEQARPSRDNP